MKRIIQLITVCAITISTLQAQTLTPQVIASTGGFASNSSGSLSYTVGEMTMVQTFSANNNILTQGFQQPSDSLIGVGLLDITDNDFISFVTYPNPAISKMWYGFMSPEQGLINVLVFDVAGQKIGEPYKGICNVGKTMENMDVSAFASGMYLITAVFISAKSGKEYTTTKRFEVIR